MMITQRVCMQTELNRDTKVTPYQKLHASWGVQLIVGNVGLPILQAPERTRK
jgi:hypothetical protein